MDNATTESAAPNIPRLVIAGTGSGAGKTSVTLGLIAALRARGLAVQPFKVGPDFLDPTWHSRAAGRPGYNLDGWMTDEAYVRDIYARQTAEADFAVIEGVMGMFDGASPDALTGSTAEIALWLDAPVVLVVNVWGLAGTVAALVKGFVEFEPRIRIAGIIANFCGSQGHAGILEKALAARNLPPLLGWLPRGGLPVLPDRHLGLRPAFSLEANETMIRELGQATETGLDLDRLLDVAAPVLPAASISPATSSLAPRTPEIAPPPTKTSAQLPGHSTGHSTAANLRMGLAKDAAFYFYYNEHLDMLRERGVEIVEFSPLADAHVPADLDFIYIGGGYPEEFAAELEANESMRSDIARFAREKYIYAECGGFMYLSRKLITLKEESFAMVGIFAFDTRMLPRRKMLGYTETTLVEDTLLGRAGDVLRGHEFHYSEICEEPELDLEQAGFRKVYSLKGRRGGKTRSEGLFNGHVLAGYVHQHFGSRPAALDFFLRTLLEKRNDTLNETSMKKSVTSAT